MSKSGGIFTFKCNSEGCGEQFDEFVWAGDKVACPKCGGEASRKITANYQKGCDYAVPVLSDAMGVHPDQVPEHRRVHPDIPMTDDGRVIIRSHAEGKRIRKQLGFFDRAGYGK